jgi:hypothetical protein
MLDFLFIVQTLKGFIKTCSHGVLTPWTPTLKGRGYRRDKVEATFLNPTLKTKNQNDSQKCKNPENDYSDSGRFTAISP